MFNVLYRLLNKFYEFLSDLRFIFFSQYQEPKRLNLLLSYLRLRLKQPFLRIFKYQKEHFLNYNIDTPDYFLFFQMFREIFVRKSYYFETDSKKPKIIDCGGNIGMSVLFFKYLYPEAEITVFEPSPEIFNFLEKNIEQNNLKNVKLVQAALYKKSGTMPLFSFAERQGGGGSTTVKGVITSKTKRHPANEESVPAVVLSEYITEPIDFLKLDIEGSEGIVIDELDESEKINFVEECVLEYHYNKENPENVLWKLLKVFQLKGFHTVIFQEEVDMPKFSGFSLKNKRFYHFLIRFYR